MAHKGQNQTFISVSGELIILSVAFVQVYMPGFLSSNLYYKYLSDLINSVRADEFVNVSTLSQSGPVDNDRSTPNASEGSQTQVTPNFNLPCSAPVGTFVCLLTFRLVPPHYKNNEDTSVDTKGPWSFGLFSGSSVSVMLPTILFTVSPLQQSAKKAVIKILKNFDEAITVDVASLDPETLYQRPYAGWALCV